MRSEQPTLFYSMYVMISWFLFPSNSISFCSGEFVVVNKHLLNDLTEMGLWSPAVKNKIIYEDGSVQKIPEIPDDLKLIYKYVQVVLFSQLSFSPYAETILV